MPQAHAEKMSQPITDISQQVSEGVSTLGERLPLILSDPKAYPREAMIIAVLVGLLLILLALLTAVVADALGARADRRRLGVRREPRWVMWAVIAAVASALFFAVLFLPATHFASRSCGGCHATSEAFDSWEADSHSTVTCYGCHSLGGFTGTIQATLRGASNLLPSGEETAPTTFAVVYQQRCTSCHEEIEEGIVGTEVRMRHSDVIEAAIPCTTCHPGTGHSGETASELVDASSVMNQCLICHDDVIATAECTVCHDGRPSDVKGLSPTGETAAPITCEGCHSPETTRNCIDCHGLVLPHPPEFMGQHAALSYKDPALCAKCHETALPYDSCACHADMNVHGSYSEWFPRHGPEALQNWPGGCMCHDVPFCAFCHTTSPF